MRDRSWLVWTGAICFGLLAGLGAYLFLSWWAVLVAIGVAAAFVAWAPSEIPTATEHRAVDSPWWIRTGIAAIVVPAISLLGSEIVLLFLAGNMDVEFALEEAGLSPGLVYTVTFGVAAVIAGALVGLVAAVRGWQLLVPSVAGLIGGLLAALLAVAFVDMGWLSVVLFVTFAGGASLLTSWQVLTHEPTQRHPTAV